MKTLNTITFVFILLFCLCLNNTLFGQINKSTKENYKERVTSSRYPYATEYDNGYITLRDGTVLYGQVSLGGKAYDKISVVKIRTNAGKRYVLSPRSLKEYGLINSLVNDTPDLFTWEQLNEKSALTGFQDIRTGSCSFGYVKTKDGKSHEGELTLKEVNGKIQQITVKNGDKKIKLESEVISNFGVTRYVDEKFVGLWSLVQWKKSVGTGMLVNIKSVPAKGVVTLTDGSTQSGFIQIIKKEEITTQIHVFADADLKKPEKLKYNDVKSYTIEQRMADYDEMLKNLDTPYDEIHPSQKFHPGVIELTDGTLIKGQIAKASNSDFTDIYFATDENSIIKGYFAAEIENSLQTISPETMASYDALMYDRNHAQDYLIQRPAQWDYESKDDMGYVTKFQQGYLIMTNGEEKVGALSVTASGSLFRYVLIENGEKVKYSGNDVKEHGLIVNQANTEFSQHLFLSTKRPGFVRLTGSDKYIKGILKLRVGNPGSQMAATEPTTIQVDGEKYDLEGVDVFGFTDVPMADMTKNGTLIYEEPKRNFHPGSFTLNGTSKEGFIAWGRPNGAGEYKAIFFAEKMDGVANVYYLKEGVSNVVQTIQPRVEQPKPIVDEFVEASDTTTSAKNPGYVITTSGEKIEGEIQVMIQPKKWYPTDVVLTRADGSVTQYSNDNSLTKFVMNVGGSEKEYLYYKGAYVEVLQRDGDLVHFRNPFPTTNSVGANILNAAIQKEQNDVNAESARKAEIAEAEGRMAVQATITINEIKIYAVEFLIFDETTGRTTMYVPNQFYYSFVEAELEGCIEYLTASAEEKGNLKKMKNPLETLEFLNENMNN